MTLFELWFSQGICPAVGLLGQDRNKDTDVENGLDNMGRGKGKLGQSERVAWTYIPYQM